MKRMAVQTKDEKGAGQQGIWQLVLADVGKPGIGHGDKNGLKKEVAN